MKELIRMKHLQLRNSLSKQEAGRKSAEISKKLFSLPEFEESKVVMFYVSFENEVATPNMIEKALELGKKVCVPISKPKEKGVVAGFIKSLSDLEKKPNGLMEPKKVVVCDPKEIDLIVVPGVVFDKEGYRIGYGGGFYDKLIRQVPRKTKAIGLCFEQNVEKRLPRQSHDAKMNKIVTEERVIGVVG